MLDSRQMLGDLMVESLASDRRLTNTGLTSRTVDGSLGVGELVGVFRGSDAAQSIDVVG